MNLKYHTPPKKKRKKKQQYAHVIEQQLFTKTTPDFMFLKAGIPTISPHSPKFPIFSVMSPQKQKSRDSRATATHVLPNLPQIKQKLDSIFMLLQKLCLISS